MFNTIKIVILDGHTANPGDLDWHEFEKLGQIEVFDRTENDQVVKRLTGATAALTNKVVIDHEALAALPSLQYIGVTATGYDMVDIRAAQERGIIVCNVPEYGTNEVAQAVFALLLELTNRVGHHAKTVRAGKWSVSADFCYWEYPLVGLAGLSLGIVGFGRIGRAVAIIGRAFGMKVIAYGPNLLSRAACADVEYTNQDTLFSRSDVISLHCPLTSVTKKLVNSDTLNKMKATAYLINTARGGLIDESELAKALNEERLGGAGLDVLSVEPPTIDNPLLTAKNCIITPHIAWANRSSRTRLLQVSAENLRAWQNGAPQNVINLK